jgi:uncharacterized protein YjbI with pentapeptide repeats
MGAIVLAVALVALVLKWAPEWLAKNGLRDNEEAQEVGRVRTALLATLAGFIAIVGAVFTGLSYRLSHAGQITERFTRAIDQLGHAELDVRLGGIYALERIARDSDDDHPQVVEVFTAYLREHARWTPGDSRGPADARQPDAQIEAIRALIAATRALERIVSGSKADPYAVGIEAPGDPPPSDDQTEPPELPTDVQAVMSVLARRDPSRDRAGARLNLARTDLRRVVLEAGEANLQDADFAGANLQGATLDGANLQGASLGGANIRGARLVLANLQDAYLVGANLQRASLGGANLRHATLNGANLEDAYLGEADLEGADLTVAKLQDAILARADLQDADLTEADLQRATLDGADLQGATLDGADLQGATLVEVNLEGASSDARTQWPDGFDALGHVDEGGL